MSRRPLTLLLLVGVVLLSCSRFRLFRPTRDVRTDAVGVVVPLSGPYRLIGEAVRDGIELAFFGSKVELIVRDSKGEPAAAAAAVEELANQERVIAILGGVAGEEAAAAADRADSLGVPFLTFSKAEDATHAGSYVFRNMPTLSSQAQAVAQFSTCELGKRNLAVLAPEAEFATELTAKFSDAVEEAGGRITRVETYKPEATTFTEQARRLTGRDQPQKRKDYVDGERKILKTETDPTRRRKALEKLRAGLPPIIDFDALFLADGWKTVSLIAPALAVEDLITNACDPADIARIQKTMGRTKLQTVTLLGWSGWSSPTGRDGVPELLTRGGKYLHCATFVDGFYEGSKRPATQAFVTRWKNSHHGQSPNLLHAVAYDSGRMFRTVLEKERPSHNNDFRDGLEDLERFDGATGQTSFDGDRNAVKPPFFLRISPAGIQELSPKANCAPQVASVP